MSSVRLPKGLSADNIIVTPPRVPSRAKNRKRKASPSPTPKTRATTRADVEGARNVDYDMKHHPMDDIIRPKAAAKRAAVKSSSPGTIRKGSNSHSGSDGSKSKTAPLKTTSSRSTERKTTGNVTPAKHDLSTLLDKPLADAWSALTPLDRRIFRLQNGAPANGKTLPFKWPQLADQLDQEGLVTRAQLQACGGIEALAERYELVRLHVQDLFGAADEATDRAEFKTKYAEGFDVYDLVGSRAEYVHLSNRCPAAEHTAKEAKVNHTETSGARVHTNGTIAAEDDQALVTLTAERTSSRSESEESDEIPWEEQVWGPGGIRSGELNDNGDSVEPLDQSREDVSALIDDVLMSQNHDSKLYEDDLSQLQPTDIVLSDCTLHSDGHSPRIADRGTQNSASAAPTKSTARPKLGNLPLPVANMTANMPDPVRVVQDAQVYVSNNIDSNAGIAGQQFDADGVSISKPIGQVRENDHTSRLGSFVLKGVETLTQFVNGHTGVRSSGSLVEPTPAGCSNTHVIDFAEQSSHGGRPTSISEEQELEREREREREKQKKIQVFATVLEHGLLLANKLTLTEVSPHTTVNSYPVKVAATDQLLKGLEPQASNEPEPGSDTPTPQIRVKSAVPSFQIFEDRAGGSPVIRKRVTLLPLSPGTDVPKENFEHDSDVDDDHTGQPVSDIFGSREHNTQPHQRGVTDSPSATGRTQRTLELSARSHITGSLFGPFAQGDTNSALATTATSQTPHSSRFCAASDETGTSASEDAVSEESPKGQKQTRAKASDFM